MTKIPSSTHSAEDGSNNPNPEVRASITVTKDQGREPRIPATLGKLHSLKGKKKDKHHRRVRVAAFRYCYYAPAFKYFVEQVLDADWLPLPPATKHTIEVGELNSVDYVCTPFKHMLGDYIDALDAGADILIQVGGPCRLGYYGELQEAILRDMGYQFEMLNYSEGIEQGAIGWGIQSIRIVNPSVSIPHALRQLGATANMVEKLDSARDFFLANGGFEQEAGSFDRAWDRFIGAMNEAASQTEISEAYRQVMDTMSTLPLDKPDRPIRIGIVGEMFTAIDERSNLDLDHKVMNMGVEVHRMMNLSNRFIHYNEPNMRRSCAEYIALDDGPTSTLTVAAAKKYAEEGFDGIIHAKSACCTPEIDCMPILQRISEDYSIPILYLTYDAQTSDTGLDTRLEAFYDMLAMKKAKSLK